MSSAVFAMPPVEVLLAIPLGMALVVVLALILVVHARDRDARRPRRGRSKDPVVRLALGSLVAGPLVGLVLALFGSWLFETNPLDVPEIVVWTILVGSIGGLFVSLVFSLAGSLPYFRRPRPKAAHHDLDELP